MNIDLPLANPWDTMESMDPINVLLAWSCYDPYKFLRDMFGTLAIAKCLFHRDITFTHSSLYIDIHIIIFAEQLSNSIRKLQTE